MTEGMGHGVNFVRDQLVVDHMSLVKGVAKRVQQSLPVQMDFDDLVHAGMMGLIDAATKFDASKEIAFKTYAKHRIRGAILDNLRKADWASRGTRKHQKKLEVVMRELTEELGRRPTDEEVAGRMGVSVEKWRQLSIDLQSGLVSLPRSADDQAQLVPEFPARPDTRPDHICERSQLSATLRFAMGALPERYQDVVFMYYTKEMTMKEIGEQMDINESRVSQIHKNALKKMAVVLQSSGIQTAAALV